MHLCKIYNLFLIVNIDFLKTLLELLKNESPFAFVSSKRSIKAVLLTECGIFQNSNISNYIKIS